MLTFQEEVPDLSGFRSFIRKPFSRCLLAEHFEALSAVIDIIKQNSQVVPNSSAVTVIRCNGDDKAINKEVDWSN